jgi:hypothetical protein
MIIDSPDWEMRAGDYRVLEIIARDKSVPPVAVDVTGYTGRLVIKRTKSGTALVNKLTSVSGEGDIPVGTDGMFRFFINAADLTGGNLPTYNVPYFWEVQGTSPGGKPYTIRTGTVKFKEPLITTVP